MSMASVSGLAGDPGLLLRAMKWVLHKRPAATSKAGNPRFAMQAMASRLSDAHGRREAARLKRSMEDIRPSILKMGRSRGRAFPNARQGLIVRGGNQTQGAPCPQKTLDRRTS